ncbi:hypothetical protein LEN26_006860 [Aphanomyces euteiches]|nr:hypothetical protein AeMF1_013814 [Aphanomyces euteiches]KAH9134141.1 hypothetical protein LEN26_006860 [Aphanomyces euteiches]KAH9184338.1 hypothetical protein AeNC1_013686 [Aphanomyces euteiches]
MKFFNLLVLLVCLLHVAVEAKKSGVVDWAKHKYTTAKHTANSKSTNIALMGLNKFEVRDKSGCNREKTFENCMGLISKLFVGQAAQATKTGLSLAQVAGLSVGIAPAIVAAVGAGAQLRKTYCSSVKELCVDKRDADLKTAMVNNQLLSQVRRRG